jgi:hypothetical protein
VPEEDLCRFLERVEERYVRRLVKSWERDPESFPEYVRQLEDVIDLRRKVCPPPQQDK